MRSIELPCGCLITTTQVVALCSTHAMKFVEMEEELKHIEDAANLKKAARRIAAHFGWKDDVDK